MDLVHIRAVLDSTPAVVRSLLMPLPEAARAFREAPDAWTPLEVLCHMIDGEVDDWIPRIEILLSAAEDRRFVPFDREAGRHKYGTWGIDALVQEFARLRTANVARLAGFAIGDGTLARTAIHPTLGTVTLGQHLACWVTHDLAHVNQITRALVRYAGADVGPWRQFFRLLRA